GKRLRPRAVGHRRHHTREVAVEACPERDELGPRRILILLTRNPRVLIVAGKRQFVLKLGSHEALMIVRRRVDQMSHDLAGRPLPRRRPLRARFVADPEELRRSAIDDGEELDDIGLHYWFIFVKTSLAVP